MSFGKPQAPKIGLVYPIIIDDDKFAFCLDLSMAKVDPSNPNFPYQDSLMSTDFGELIARERKQATAPPETVDVDKLLGPQLVVAKAKA